MSGSEIAQFRALQALEEASARNGLCGTAIVGSHESINARMQQGGQILLGLFEEGRDDEAYDLWDAGILG